MTHKLITKREEDHRFFAERFDLWKKWLFPAVHESFTIAYFYLAHCQDKMGHEKRAFSWEGRPLIGVGEEFVLTLKDGAGNSGELPGCVVPAAVIKRLDRAGEEILRLHIPKEVIPGQIGEVAVMDYNWVNPKMPQPRFWPEDFDCRVLIPVGLDSETPVYTG